MEFKRIILVGNALPKKDYSLLIDSCDFVVRFNHVNYLTSNKIGKKCNVLVVQNMDEKYRTGKATLNNWEKLIIIAENKKKDYSELILSSNDWKERQYSVIYSDSLEITKKLNANGGSSGFIILEWLLKNREFHQMHISLVCFTWEGWNGHAWDQEKEICHNYEMKGLLEIIK